MASKKTPLQKSAKVLP